MGPAVGLVMYRNVVFFLLLMISGVIFAKGHIANPPNKYLLKPSQFLTPCQQKFTRSGVNICFDSKDSKYYPIVAQIACIINPNAKNVPEWLNSYCNGELHSYSPGQTNRVELQVTDHHNPPHFLAKFIHIQIGVCTANFKCADLNRLAGRIFSCNPQTHRFEIRQSVYKTN